MIFREDNGAWSTVPGAGYRLSVNRSERDKPESEHRWLRHESKLQAARLISIIIIISFCSSDYYLRSISEKKPDDQTADLIVRA